MYSDSGYLSFSFLGGLDEPPTEQLSSTVTIIILVGFGLPLAAIILSSVYLGVKRFRRSSYDNVLIDSSES